MKTFGQIFLVLVLIVGAAIAYHHFLRPIFEPRVIAAPPPPKPPPEQALNIPPPRHDGPRPCQLEIEEERKKLRNLRAASREWEQKQQQSRADAEAETRRDEEHCYSLYQTDDKRYSVETAKRQRECLAAARNSSSRQSARNPQSDFISQLQRKISAMQSQCR